MILLFQLFLISIFLLVFWQDYNDRMVYWFLFPIIGILSFCIQVYQVSFYMSVINSIINLVIITIVFLVIMGYSKFILHKAFSEAFGLGDVLLLFALTFTFSTISFIFLFVFSLLFSLLLHFLLKKKYKIDETVPLAGYISLFFAGIYIVAFFLDSNELYF